MKTTVEIPDPLAEEARAVARRDETTLRELIETGLRLVLRERRRKARFRLRDASFRGRGLRPEYQDEDWQRIRSAAYEGRGGRSPSIRISSSTLDHEDAPEPRKPVGEEG